MIKSNIQSPEKVNKEKQVARKNQRIKELLYLIQQSKSKQKDLLNAISLQRITIEQKQNMLGGTQTYSLVDLDIRNSQLVGSLELQRKRWLGQKPKQDVQILGEEPELKQKIVQIKAEEKPSQKAKMLKIMKRKLQLLQNLSKIRADSGLSVSHQRVLLKQYLEDIRVMNTEMEQSNKRYGKLQIQYGQAERKLRNTVNDLKVTVAHSKTKEGQ